jgi:hypothetical protein
MHMTGWPKMLAEPNLERIVHEHVSVGIPAVWLESEALGAEANLGKLINARLPHSFL